MLGINGRMGLCAVWSVVSSEGNSVCFTATITDMVCCAMQLRPCVCFSNRNSKRRSFQEMHCHHNLHGKWGRCFGACFGANRSTRVTWSCGERSGVRGQTVAAEN